MTPRGVYVAGTRSFAAEVVDFAHDAGLWVLGLIDPHGERRTGETIHGLTVRSIEETSSDSLSVIVGTGDAARRDVVGRLEAAGWKPFALVHPRAHLAPTCRVGEGALVGPGVVVGARAKLADHVVLGRGALVGHHTVIDEFATLGPGSNVAGNVRIEPDAFLGMAAVVRDHVVVGASSVVAMGAVVVSDVPPSASVRGVPARESPETVRAQSDAGGR